MSYATISDISRRWQVDRATARAALQRAGVPPCDFFASSRYSWNEVFRKIEAWPALSLTQIDRDARLETAEALADHFGVTPQTIRNHGRTGRFHRIEITPRAARYGALFIAKNYFLSNNYLVLRKISFCTFTGISDSHYTKPEKGFPDEICKPDHRRVPDRL